VRIFVAGATGVIGKPLVSLLLAEGHTVAGMTRSPDKADELRALGAEPVICDVYDAEGLAEAVRAFGPDLVMHQLTDLPDQRERISEFAERNNRIRTEGTRNLVAAAQAAGAKRLLAQSISWEPPAGAEAIEEHERTVLDAGGVVVRYGQLYGPGTYHEDDVPEPPRIHVEEAARRTVELLDAGTGAIVVTDRVEP
jgi:nucleoside-diphosphate-sugar epimerase